MRQRVPGVVMITAVLAACDIRTASSTWNGSAFQTTLNAITLTRTLAQDCAACTSGTAAPKPAYTATATSSATFLPPNTTSVTSQFRGSAS